MPKLVLHPLTDAAIRDYIAHPAHALLITGQAGSGKASLAEHMVEQILGHTSVEQTIYESHPYVRIVRSEDGKAIPVEAIRNIQQFLTLKIPGSSAEKIGRVIVIEDAHLLTTESQNALLKTLEEPPADTVLLLTALSTESVLPTIQSRSRQLAVLPPPRQELTDHFMSLGHGGEAISRAMMLSGELPGLASALLTGEQEHPLVTATTHARGILGSKTYERLLLVDGLSKQKQLCLDVLYVLAQMSRMALMRSTDVASAQRWQKVLRASYAAREQLSHNTQTKLVLTNLMLDL